MTFRQMTFWGGLGYVARRLVPAPRARPTITACSNGARATTTPPIGRRRCVDETGRDLRTGAWLDADDDGRRGVRLYHYSLLLPKQVIEKCDYYATRGLGAPHRRRRVGATRPTSSSSGRSGSTTCSPTRAGWSGTRGPHPDEVVAMIDGLRAADGAIALRRDRRHRAPARRALVPRRTRGRAGGSTRWIDASIARRTGSGAWHRRVRRAGRRARRGIRRAGRPVVRAGRRSSVSARRARDGRPGRSAAAGRPGDQARPGRGGAERVAMSLHRGLLDRGHRSWMATTARDRDDPDAAHDSQPRKRSRPTSPAACCVARAGSPVGTPRPRERRPLDRTGTHDRGRTGTVHRRPSAGGRCSTSRERAGSPASRRSRRTWSTCTTSTAATSTCASSRR